MQRQSEHDNFSHLFWKSFICPCQKNFMCGVASILCPPIILRRSFSSNSYPLPLYQSCFQITRWRPLFFSLVSITVAHNFSGLHALRDALLLAGADDALDFFVSARSSACISLVHCHIYFHDYKSLWWLCIRQNGSSQRSQNWWRMNVLKQNVV